MFFQKLGCTDCGICSLYCACLFSELIDLDNGNLTGNLLWTNPKDPDNEDYILT